MITLINEILSAEQLRVKSGKTMVGGAAVGHRDFLQRGWTARAGKFIPAQVLADLQGRGLVRKEAFQQT